MPRFTPHAGRLLSIALLTAVALPAAAQHDGHESDPSDVDRQAVTASRGLLGLFPNLRIGGFSDFSYHSATDVVGREGFAEGQFVLHLSSRLGRRIRYFSEMALTARPDHAFAATIERTQVKFDLMTGLALTAGRLHTPITHWNTTYHHGQWLQPTVDRPQVTRFGSRFIPIHVVGAQFEGRHTLAGREITYSLGVGNGRQEGDFAQAGDSGDDDGHRATTAAASVQATRWLRLGGALYRDRVSFLNPEFEVPEPEIDAKFVERIASGHVVAKAGRTQFLAEGVRVHHRSTATGANWASIGWYVQLSQRLAAFEDRFMIYARMDRIDVADTDLVFCSQGLKGWKGHVAGVRADVGPFSAIKMEVRQSKQPGLDYSYDLVAQISYTF